MKTSTLPPTIAHFLLGLALLIAPSVVNAQVRQYEANFTSSPPAIDGILTDGEWDAAAGGGGEWENIRTARVEDDENNRFRVLWDQQGIYVLGESDYDFWGDDKNGQNPAASDFNGDFFNVFLDPNTLGEENIGQLDEEIDNYQIGFNVYADARSCGGDRIAGTADDCTQEPNPDEPLPPNGVNVTGLTFGTLTAAHVDGLFNNDTEWEHLRATHISYTASEEGAVIEMFMPWEEFDALEVTNPVDENGEPTGDGVETGLHHPFAPSNGDVWFFNVTRQSTEPTNFLPQWHWTSSEFFASHGLEGAEGHGELIFVGAPDAPTLLPADFDGSGTVDFPDFLILSNSFGQSAAASAVPEPSSLGLLILGALALGIVRGRRS